MLHLYGTYEQVISYVHVHYQVQNYLMTRPTKSIGKTSFIHSEENRYIFFLLHKSQIVEIYPLDKNTKENSLVNTSPVPVIVFNQISHSSVF